MAVMLPDRMLTVTVRAHPEKRDARGTPMATAQDAEDVRGPYLGAAFRQLDGSWKLRVDPRCWPMRMGDKITDDQGNTWYAAHEPQYRKHPVDDVCDCINVTGTLDPPLVP